jgi:S-adenosylmethionine decarboxylase
MPETRASQRTKTISKKELVTGKHVYGNLYDINPELLHDTEFLSRVISESAKIGNMHIVETIIKKFQNLKGGIDGGVSVIALIKESHITIHTWPEGNYAAVDVFSCGQQSSPEKAFEYIILKLKPKTYKMFRADRGNATST